MAIQELISLGGPGWAMEDRHANDLRYYNNAQVIQQAGFKYVKFWVSWADLQPTYSPPSRDASWDDLNKAKPMFDRALGRTAPALQRLDDQIRLANDLGKFVILGIYQAYPTWSNGAGGSEFGTGKPAEARIPSAADMDSPWAWLISHLLARYRAGAPVNPRTGDLNDPRGGPHAPRPGENTSGYDPYMGNSRGAFAQALEVVNEPNFELWPQGSANWNRIAQMMRTAAELSVQWGQRAPSNPNFIKAIWGPALSDSDSTNVKQTSAVDYAEELLALLIGWNPLPHVRWTHHIYNDIEYEQTAYAQAVANRLRAYDWLEGDNSEVWITEGGYRLRNTYPSDDAATRSQDQAVQYKKVALAIRSFEESQATFPVFAQHGISDAYNNNFRTAMFDEDWTKDGDSDANISNGNDGMGARGKARLVYNAYLAHTT